MNLKTLLGGCFVFLFFACSEDIDITTPRNLQEYLDINNSLSSENVIAFAANDKTNHKTLYIYYYPKDNPQDIRYYETENTDVDPNIYTNYTRKILVKQDVFGGHLQKFIRPNTQKERWCLITFKAKGELHKSKPIRIKNLSKPTEWKNTIHINNPQTLEPKFSWDNGNITENTIYFEALTDIENTLLSGTFTTEKTFWYYHVDNVVLNLTTQTPPSLILDHEYKFTIFGISQDNWVNLVLEKTFIAE